MNSLLARALNEFLQEGGEGALRTGDEFCILQPQEQLDAVINLIGLRDPYLLQLDTASAARALWHLAGESGFLYPILTQILRTSRSPTAELERYLSGLEILYFDYFAMRAIPPAADADWPYSKMDDLSAICYMWWDVTGFFEISSQSKDEAARELILNKFYDWLDREVPIVTLSVLHGVQHFYSTAGQAAVAVVRRWLQKKVERPLWLIDYAHEATFGELRSKP